MLMLPPVEAANSAGEASSLESTRCAEEPAIVGTWLLHELTLDGVTYGLDDPALMTGEYPDVAARAATHRRAFQRAAPCNDFQGSHSLEGSTLQVFDATVSAVACDPPMIMYAEVLIVRTFSNEAVIGEVVFEGPETLTLGSRPNYRSPSTGSIGPPTADRVARGSAGRSSSAPGASSRDAGTVWSSVSASLPPCRTAAASISTSWSA